MQNRRHTPRPSLSSVGLVAALVGGGGVGCDALTDPDYRGEPILTLQGAVESALQADDEVVTDGVKVAIVWATGDARADNPIPVAETTAVRGSFPANFTLDVFHPPAANELVTLPDGTSVGLGFIVALPADAATGDAVNLEEMIGVTNRHALVYIPDEAARDVVVVDSPVLAGVDIGFNLLDIEADTPAAERCRANAVEAIDACYQACEEACAGDDEDDARCEACLETCQDDDLDADLRACDALREAIVPDDTSLELVLDPDSVEDSTVWGLFGLGGAGGDDNTDEPRSSDDI